MNNKNIVCVFLLFFLKFLFCEQRFIFADVFTTPLIVKEDRAGFNISLPAVEKNTLYKIKKYSQTKQPELKNVGHLEIENLLDQDLRYFIQQDKKTLFDHETRLSNNKLLLLSYASPAMADILKHYRMFALERMQLEYAKYDIDRAEDQDIVMIFYRDSFNRCIYRESKKGFIVATELCRQKEPFSYIKNASGWYVSEDRPWEVLKDLLERVGLSSQHIRLVGSLCGEIVVTSSKIQQRSPYKSLEEEISLHAKNVYDRWKNIMMKKQRHEEITIVDLENLVCAGLEITTSFLEDLSMLKQVEQEIFMLKFSQNCSRMEIQTQLKESLVFFEQAQQWLGLEKGAIKVLENKQKMVEKLLFKFKSVDLLEKGQLLMKGVMESADIVRTLLL